MHIYFVFLIRVLSWTETFWMCLATLNGCLKQISGELQFDLPGRPDSPGSPGDPGKPLTPFSPGFPGLPTQEWKTHFIVLLSKCVNNTCWHVVHLSVMCIDHCNDLAWVTNKSCVPFRSLSSRSSWDTHCSLLSLLSRFTRETRGAYISL